MRWISVLAAGSLFVAGCSVQTIVTPDAGAPPERDAGAVVRDAGAPVDAGAFDAGPCPAGEVMRFGVCVPIPARCDGACANDACCVSGECIPHGVGPCPVADGTCEVGPPEGRFAPVVECEWTGTARDSSATPTVGDLDMDGDPSTRHVSIAVVTMNGRLVLLDGASCAEQANLPIDAHPAGSPVFADLNADGRADLVVNRYPFVRAYTWDVAAGALVELWETRAAGGPHLAVHDLDDDGRPEILAGSYVIDATGVPRIVADTDLSSGGVPTVADVDADGRPELVTPDGVFEADLALGDWRRESYWRAGGALPRRAVAVADFGDFGDGAGVAELAFAGQGQFVLTRVTGEPLLGPVQVAPNHGAGPPLIVDFDGDGQPEIGVVGDDAYWVFDLGCTATPLPAECAAPGILWRHPVQDQSTGKTGSTAFDFDGDGRMEIVYADECFLRFFDGPTGALEFSAPHASATIIEHPVVADVDDDGRAELIVPRNVAYFHSCVDPYDPYFFGDACDPVDRPCTSDLHACVDGVCRAPREGGWGIRVFGDAANFWAGTRPIWNQYSYSVTNVADDGTVPRTSAWAPAWSAPETNRFRVNEQGPVPDAVPAPDLTVGPVSGWTCDGASRQRFVARVCNRGAMAVVSSPPVGFYAEGERICEARARAGLEPGACDEVTCEWRGAPENPVDVRAQVDDERRYVHQIRECREDNNEALFTARCDVI